LWRDKLCSRLVGVLVLRELGVLLTAEIGLMKMGEEIDALRVM